MQDLWFMCTLFVAQFLLALIPAVAEVREQCRTTNAGGDDE